MMQAPAVSSFPKPCKQPLSLSALQLPAVAAVQSWHGLRHWAAQTKGFELSFRNPSAQTVQTVAEEHYSHPAMLQATQVLLTL